MHLDNPLQTDGFEFVEFTSPFPGDLESLFTCMGFTAIAQHRRKKITLYRQGEVNFLINREPNSYAFRYAEKHGPSACAMAFRVKEAKLAHTCAVSLGAHSVASEDQLFAISGVGESVLFLIDHHKDQTFYDREFTYFPGVDLNPKGFGLTHIDHLTHNVYQGCTGIWTGFYQKIFHFREHQSFSITGKKTGLLSRVMRSPCGKICIPINESADDKSQISEYLIDYKGEGIQHIALGTNSICGSVEQLKNQKIPFVKVPELYYQILENRLPQHGQDMRRLAKNHILMDGEKTSDQMNLLLQIFTKPVIGPIFFEVIQRLGHQGFGEGNFLALFEAIERDQEARGVL